MILSPIRLDDPMVRRAIHEHVNLALAQGALYAAGVGVIGTLALLGVMLTSASPAVWRLPMVFGTFATGYCALLWYAGHTRRVRGVTALLLMAGFVSIPTAYFLAAETWLPAGAGAHINGAIAFVYLPMIAVSGFVHSFRVSAVCGLVAGAGYLTAFFLARPELLQVSTPSPEMHRILSSPFVATMKSLLMLGTGVITGAVSIVSRRLLLRTLDEQRQKESVQRLFGQYVGGVVSERILERAAESRGERVEVVVLFADLRGFSSFSEGRDPAEVVERLNAYFERMVEAISAEGGVVDKFIGDAVMAIFGGLVAIKNPCEAAVRAAFGMREALGQLNADWARAGIEPFDNGIGLHIGEVLQGPIGSPDRKEFTAIGDAVNSAARLEGLTKANETPVLITDAVHDKLPEALQRRFKTLGNVSVKGKRDELAIYGWDGEAR